MHGRCRTTTTCTHINDCDPLKDENGLTSLTIRPYELVLHRGLGQDVRQEPGGETGSISLFPWQASYEGNMYRTGRVGLVGVVFVKAR
jgi:hypothetical protein